ncbi:MAG: DUF4234 domain-containing protein [Pyrinomonadaceae bacterium]
MIFCANCGQANTDAARACVSCGLPFTGQGNSTPFTTTPLQTATDARGQQPVDAALPAPSVDNALQETELAPQVSGLLATGKRRDPLMVLALSLVTCFIYLVYWWYISGVEIKNALGREDLNPTLDTILGVVTCFIYFIYLAVRYPQLIMELQAKAGMPRTEIPVVSQVLYILFAPVSAFMIQSELNKIWEFAEGQS